MEIFTSILTGAVSGVVVVFLLRTWVEARIKSSIQHEYNQQFELFKRQLDQKQKVELVSDILAHWIAYPPDVPVSKEHRTTMNRLIFAATLWLPAEHVRKLNAALQHEGSPDELFRMLLLARKELTGDVGLRENELAFMPYELEVSGKPYPPVEGAI